MWRMFGAYCINAEDGKEKGQYSLGHHGGDKCNLENVDHKGDAQT